MRKKVLIFGGSGQDGTFLKDLYLNEGYEVLAFSRSVDVSDFPKISQIIKDQQADYIFHLAAKSSTRHEFILENHKAIVDGALAVLESVDRYSAHSRVFLASSALVFKNNGNPLTEDCELVTDSAYAMARVEALQIARYFRTRGRSVFTGFMLNHESPLRPPQSIARKIANDVAQIHLGKMAHFEVGNANTVKEWTWAGDVVRAFPVLINQDDIHEVIIGDGIGKSIKEYASACCDVVGLNLKDHLIEAHNYSSEYGSLVSGSIKMRSLGWRPLVNFEQLAKLMVNDALLKNQGN